MLVGYARVSKADGSQTTDLQRDALLAAGVGSESLYEDKASGKQEDRPELAACLKALRPGDLLVVWKIDRLGRDLRHLVNIVHELTEVLNIFAEYPSNSHDKSIDGVELAPARDTY